MSLDIERIQMKLPRSVVDSDMISDAIERVTEAASYQRGLLRQVRETLERLASLEDANNDYQTGATREVVESDGRPSGVVEHLQRADGALRTETGLPSGSNIAG